MKSKPTNDFRVLVTASGLTPVGFNTIFSLRGEVKKIVGVDVKSESCAEQFCDSYYRVPLASNESYISQIIDICIKEDVNIILPLTIEETLVLKKNEKELNNTGIFVANSNSIKNIEICNDKFLTNQYLKNFGINVPNAIPVSSRNELISAASILGYPEKDVVFKPRITHGSRGFRILTKHYDRLDLVLGKPTDNIFLSLEDLKYIIGENEVCCMVMDKLDGDDYSVYSFALDGDPLVIVPMKRSGLVPGMSTGGQVIKDEQIIGYVSKIISAFKFNGAINVQLKLTKEGPLLYEINSRLSATTVMVRSGQLNFPLYEIMLARGKHDIIRDSISQSHIKWGVKMERIHQEVYNDNGNYFVLKNKATF